MNIHYHYNLQYYMKSVQHILGYNDSGPAPGLHIYADKAMKETVYLWHQYYNEAKILYDT
jgi:hypothetical protein